MEINAPQPATVPERVTGLSHGKITEIKRGSRPSKVERTALFWAIAKGSGL